MPEITETKSDRQDQACGLGVLEQCVLDRQATPAHAVEEVKFVVKPASKEKVISIEGKVVRLISSDPLYPSTPQHPVPKPQPSSPTSSYPKHASKKTSAAALWQS